MMMTHIRNDVGKNLGMVVYVHEQVTTQVRYTNMYLYYLYLSVLIFMRMKMGLKNRLVTFVGYKHGP